uniref:uncharacterized protein LOC120884096 n=1 Tax=Ictidomys tridecemlineatus TaxID=43179 RepID=UPI001A9F9E73|nr:uncharacterized protein LOC120884096 [Ictidomys tridecemlineatus]
MESSREDEGGGERGEGQREVRDSGFNHSVALVLGVSWKELAFPSSGLFTRVGLSVATKRVLLSCPGWPQTCPPAFRLYSSWNYRGAQFGPIVGEAEIDVPRLPSGDRKENSTICALWRPQVGAGMLRRQRAAAHSGGSLSPGHLETPCSGHCLVPPEVPAEAAPEECQLPDLSASHSLHQLHTHSNPGPVGCFHSLKKRP